MKTKWNDWYCEIEPEDGLFLTQKELGENTRIFSTNIITAHPEQWEEWTAEQEEAWEEEHSGEEEEM